MLKPVSTFPAEINRSPIVPACTWHLWAELLWPAWSRLRRRWAFRSSCERCGDLSGFNLSQSSHPLLRGLEELANLLHMGAHEAARLVYER